MNIINNIVNSYKHILYTLKHIIWINRIAKRYYDCHFFLHDIDKLLMYIFLPFMGTKWIQEFHRSHSRHHVNNKVKTCMNEIEMVCDWESARYTKPDKPLNARETCIKYYPDQFSNLETYFDHFDIIDTFRKYDSNNNNNNNSNTNYI